ncbi:DNA/RNA helicase domain-containing protein [Sphingomonas changnyeongensis]|uniref:DNA/RNA helicase domain-containing protein n=1 Tax=Sphingomonas changnyeongensis TaxID=2698679 RepID=UPI001E4BF8F5|nr:DNA/RNA helicase domain-containing protein [Sphingomonas changnyeongensis]
MRSFRAEQLSAFVGHVVNGSADDARSILTELSGRYPIAATRDIGTARAWLQSRARGSERYGLVASSGAHRLRPEGIQVNAKIDPPTWFLNDKWDVRSSFYLEEVATQFDVQGLELDWTCVCWDADLRFSGNSWQFFAFKGTAWRNVNDRSKQLYMTNAYRVLLTRARQGMIIFIPKGDSKDPTRLPSFYNDTFAFLQRCGVPELYGQ